MFKAIKKFFDDLFTLTTIPPKEQPVINWECPVCGCKEYEQTSHKEWRFAELGSYEQTIYDPYYNCESCTFIFKDPAKSCSVIDKTLVGISQTNGG